MRFWQEEGRPKDYELYERLLEDAAGEFCQLFVLPNGVSPLASAWLPGGDPNRAAGLAAVTRALRAEGQLELPDALGVLPDDHVSVVLALGSWMMSDPDVRRDGEIPSLSRPSPSAGRSRSASGDRPWPAPAR